MEGGHFILSNNNYIPTLEAKSDLKERQQLLHLRPSLRSGAVGGNDHDRSRQVNNHCSCHE
jgi:hypothetical protein